MGFVPAKAAQLIEIKAKLYYNHFRVLSLPEQPENKTILKKLIKTRQTKTRVLSLPEQPDVKHTAGFVTARAARQTRIYTYVVK